MAELRFDGSVWCNLDVALRHVDDLYTQETQQLGLLVIEWYILQVLYEKDGQMASHLAQAVGRAATSFTPILDKLVAKGFIERRVHPSDRRGVLIFLTEQGNALREDVLASVERIETKIRQKFTAKEVKSYQHVLANLQSMPQLD